MADERNAISGLKLGWQSSSGRCANLLGHLRETMADAIAEHVIAIDCDSLVRQLLDQHVAAQDFAVDQHPVAIEYNERVLRRRAVHDIFLRARSVSTISRRFGRLRSLRKRSRR